MEGKDGTRVEATMKIDGAQEIHMQVPRNETLAQFSGSVMAATPLVMVSPTGMEMEKKKRGRPRKTDEERKAYQDRKLAMALSPMPISASIPMTGDFSTWKRPVEDSCKKQSKFEVQSSGEGVAYSIGANFTPHVLSINAGEDVTMKIMSFSQQGSRAICIISANGTISNVTLRQPNTSGGTLTYEGRFEILSLSGSFMPSESGGTKSRSGGMSVSLAGPDGRVVGGGLAGMLVAAGPVQVVIGSFLQGHQQEQGKKHKIEHRSPDTPYPIHPVATKDPPNHMTGPYSGLKPILTPASLPGDDNSNSASFNNNQSSRNFITENKPSESKEVIYGGLKGIVTTVPFLGDNNRPPSAEEPMKL